MPFDWLDQDFAECIMPLDWLDQDLAECIMPFDWLDQHLADGATYRRPAGQESCR